MHIRNSQLNLTMFLYNCLVDRVLSMFLNFYSFDAFHVEIGELIIHSNINCMFSFIFRVCVPYEHLVIITTMNEIIKMPRKCQNKPNAH